MYYIASKLGEALKLIFDDGSHFGGYKYFTEAARMSESYQYLRVRVQLEQQRFLSFAKEAGILYSDGKLCGTLQVNQTVLKEVLVEINSLFRSYEDRNGKYKHIGMHSDIQWDDKEEPRTGITDFFSIPTGNSVKDYKLVEGHKPVSLPKSLHKIRNRTMVATRKLRTIFTEPKRLVWVSIDKEGFETLVSKLADLNSFLVGLLGASQERRLEEAVEMNHLEILQLRNDVKDLQTLIKALSWDATEHHKIATLPSSTCCENPFIEAALIERQADESKRENLKKLAEIKIRHIEFCQPQKTCGSPNSNRYDVLLDISTLTFQDGQEYNQGKRSIASWKSHEVWVEWFEKTSITSRDDIAKTLREDRIILLARLLRKEMPSSFRTPRCLGYIKSPWQETVRDFGIVFESPCGSHGESELVTLRQLLGSRPKPTITRRISLASSLADCLFSLHSIDWMHKGLRSDNIIFFYAQRAGPCLEMPYVTGYELSRPSDIPEMTEKPPSDPWTDIYRHPYAQSSEVKSTYRKAYDMYSLGIILIEIAFWKPIEMILGIGDLATMEHHSLRSIRGRLLGCSDDNIEANRSTSVSSDSECLLEVGRKFGDAYRDIVEICLCANEVERPMYRGEPQASIASRLRAMFKQHVTDKLRSMKEALSSIG
ncbi:hypothetical protein K445DRAFT_379520 [Daldinia sp. EC12]|nr:hypothetical protein K445DRAFT_379520 [Daldinia sp. EC12]